MTFEQELIALVEKARADGTPQADVEEAVAELHQRHDKKIPPPITGTITVTEPEDSLGS
jgi:hypothetical protein